MLLARKFATIVLRTVPKWATGCRSAPKCVRVVPRAVEKCLRIKEKSVMKLLKYLFALVVLGLPGVSSANDTNESMSSGSKEIQQIVEKSSKKMPSMKMCGKVDGDFAAMMAIHHESAIEMAEVELKEGKDPELKAMAKNMIEMQKKEKSELERRSKSYQ